MRCEAILRGGGALPETMHDVVGVEEAYEHVRQVE